jgi:uncharacterized membrane protein YhhN
MSDSSTHRSGSPGPNALFFIAATISLSHLAAPLVELPYPQEVVWKAGGIFLLGVHALLRRARLVSLALFFSSVGDVMLDLKPQQMVAGMASFGVAHVFFSLAFAGFLRRHRMGVAGLLPAGIVLAVSTTLLFWFLPGMDALTVPGLGYHAIITVMVIVAMLSRAPVPAKVGAAVFMLSDTLIALDLYKGIDLPGGSVWITYAFAQIMLAWTLSIRRPS